MNLTSDLWNNNVISIIAIIDKPASNLNDFDQTLSLESLQKAIIRHLGCCCRSLNELGSVSSVCRAEVTV